MNWVKSRLESSLGLSEVKLHAIVLDFYDVPVDGALFSRELIASI